MVDSRARWALPALVAGAAAIGAAPILVRLSGSDGVGPTATAFWRLALALPILWAWRRTERGPAPSRRDTLLLLGIGLFFAADLAFWHASILLTRIANATLLTCLASTFAALAAWILFRERVTGLLLAGLVVALAGAGLLMSGSDSSGHRLGDALGILAAIFYAGYLLGIGRLRARLSTATAMAWSGLGAAAGLLVAALALRETFLPASGRGWLVLAALALVGQLAGQSLIAYALAHLSMAFSAIALLIQPVVAALLSWALFHETLGPLQFAGGALVLAGIVAAKISPRSSVLGQDPPPSPPGGGEGGR
ncbi:MAG TPA: DMT family transporter [Planctomycetota bacterium]|nr:DMT family transporter [Planctomycetota bacterium]